MSSKRRPLIGADNSSARLALLLNLPSIALIVAVLIAPLCYAVYLSLARVNIADLRAGFPFRFVGLQNFVQLWNDALFWLSLQHTLVFAVIVVMVEIVAGLGIALLMQNTSVRLARAIKLLILLPYAVPPVANGLVWAYIYNPNNGFLNRLLYNLGLLHDYVDWLGNSSLVMLALAAPYVWRTLPFAVLLFHAALQSLPKEQTEAAQIDGAGYWQTFLWITLPQLAPVVVVVLILRTIFAFLVFDEVLAITQGGPGDASWVASWYAYKKSFQPPFAIGLGSAASFVLAILLVVLALVYVKLLLGRVRR